MEVTIGPSHGDIEGEITPEPRSRERSSSLDAWLEDAHAPHVPNLLAKALRERPSREQLERRGILESGPRDSISSLNAWLDDEEGATPHVPNSLAKALARRPSRELVVSSGILRSPIEATGKKLARRSLETQLSAALEKRPSAEALILQGILHSHTSEPPQPVDPLDAAEKGQSLTPPMASPVYPAGDYY